MLVRYLTNYYRSPKLSLKHSIYPQKASFNNEDDVHVVKN